MQAAKRFDWKIRMPKMMEKIRNLVNMPLLISLLLFYPALYLLMRIPDAWSSSLGALYMQQGSAMQTVTQVGWELLCLIVFNLVFICATGVCLREVKLKQSFEDLRSSILFLWILFQAFVLFVPFLLKNVLLGVGAPVWVSFATAYIINYFLCILLFCCSPIEESWTLAMRLRIKKNLALFFVAGVATALVCATLATLIPTGSGGFGFQLLDTFYQWIVLSTAFVVCIQMKNSIPVQD